MTTPDPRVVEGTTVPTDPTAEPVIVVKTSRLKAGAKKFATVVGVPVLIGATAAWVVSRNASVDDEDSDEDTDLTED